MILGLCKIDLVIEKYPIFFRSITMIFFWQGNKRTVAPNPFKAKNTLAISNGCLFTQ